MSYDISAYCPCCDSEIVDWNYTSNCEPMWRAAGADLAEFEGQRATDCYLVLSEAIPKMQDDPETFRAMDPPNGWGNYETLVPALIELRNALLRAPADAIVRVSR